MKKHLFFLFAATAVACNVLFTSCDEDPASELSIENLKTATIEGTYLVVTDFTKDTTTLKTPSNIVVTAEIPYSELSPEATATGVYSVTGTYSNGKYSVTVPTSVKGSNVTVKLSQINGSVKKVDSTTVNVIWADETIDAGKLYPDQKITLDNKIITSGYTEVKTAGSEYVK